MKLEKFKKELIAVFSLTAMAFSGYFWLDNTFARNKGLVELTGVVQQMQTEYQRDSLQKRIWALEDRYECLGLKECQKVMPQSVFEEYRELLEKIEKLK